jgi:type III pantothenate kinase
MLLAADVGNSETVLGIYEAEHLVEHWRLQTVAGRTSDEYGVLVRSLLAQAGHAPSEVDQVALCCVVPPVLPRWVDMATRVFGIEPLVVGPGVRTGVSVLYEQPRDVGADRICNAAAAFERFHASCVVVDFGTATILDVVSQKGEYLGGVICPGVATSLDALVSHASKLPRIELKRPPRVMGRDTVGSMQSGLIYGFVSLVDGMVARLSAELGDTPRVIATGGSAPLFAAESRTIEAVDEFLTLTGLRLIHARQERTTPLAEKTR